MARPLTPLLSEARILDATRELARDGEFTLAQLAHALGVRVSSIYHHVPSKAALVHLLRRDWAARLRPELAESAGRERLDRIVRSYALFATSIPALVPLLVAEPLRDDDALWLYEDLAATFGELGFPAERVLPAIAAIDAIVLGAAFDLLSPPFEAAGIPNPDYPMLSAALETFPEDGDRRAHLLGTIDHLIDGLLGLAGTRAAQPGSSHGPEESASPRIDAEENK